MKNTFFVLVSLFLILNSAHAQKKKASVVKDVAVPENVNTSFKSLYNQVADNKWNKNYSGNYVASFKNADNQKQAVEFSGTGAVVKSRIEYEVGSLPENINTSINSQYPETTIIEASKFQMPGVAPYYKVKINGSGNSGKELLISEEGTITE